MTLLVAACSGSESPNASSPAVAATSVTSTSAPTSTAVEQVPVAPRTAPAPVTALTAAEVPALVNEWGDGGGDPLDLAQRIIGFPVDIGVPDGSTSFDMSVQASVSDPGVSRSWAWTYEALSMVGAIDPELPDGGPGSAETRDFYDPILESLGWYEAAQVISSPGSGAAGPRSVNFAYKPNIDTLRVGGVDATPVVAKVWADEDLDFMPGPDQPGYRIDLRAEVRSDFIPASIPALLQDQLSAVPGAILRKVRFASSRQLSDSQSPDIYDFREGDRLLELEIVLDLPAESTDLAREAYSNGLDGSIYQMGQPSFMARGVIDMAQPTVDGNTWTQRIVVLDRYSGTIRVVTDPDTNTATATVEVRLEPNREVLSPT